MIRTCLVLYFFCLLCVSPAIAEIQPSNSPPQESDLEESEAAPESDAVVPQRHVPFAQYEEKLRNSERWKTLTPEEQQEALGKIQHYRKLYREQQLELQNQYKSLLEKKSKKRSSLSRRRRAESKMKFEDVWGKWESLTPNRQSVLSKKWNIRKTKSRKEREEVLRVWKKLLPVTRLQFFRDLE